MHAFFQKDVKQNHRNLYVDTIDDNPDRRLTSGREARNSNNGGMNDLIESVERELRHLALESKSGNREGTERQVIRQWRIRLASKGKGSVGCASSSASGARSARCILACILRARASFVVVRDSFDRLSLVNLMESSSLL